MKMIVAGRSPHMRHVRINLDSNFSMKYVHANQQIADNFNERFFHTISGMR